MVITFGPIKNGKLICSNEVEARERALTSAMVNALTEVDKDFHKAFPDCVKNVSVVYNKYINKYEYKHTVFVRDEYDSLFHFDFESGKFEDIHYGKYFTTLKEAQDQMLEYERAGQLYDLKMKYHLLKKKCQTLTEQLSDATEELAQVERDIKNF